MQYSNPILTPTEPSASRHNEDNSNTIELARYISYRQYIVIIVYLIIIEIPYIAYDVGILTQYCDKALKTHWLLWNEYCDTSKEQSRNS